MAENNDSSKVSFGKPKSIGAIFVAPIGTTLPTNATSSLDAAFENMGYANEDGLVNGVETDTEDVNEWGGELVLSEQSSFKEMFTVNLIETKESVLKLYYGDDNVEVDGSGNIAVRVNSKTLPEVSVVFELVLHGNRVKRIVIERAKIADRSAEINYQKGEAIAYPAVFTALPSTVDGDSHKEYIANIAS